MKQYTLLTASGINKLLKTASDGSKIALKEVVVSDYDGELSEQTTSIPNEKYRGAINAVTIDENDNNILDVDAIIPPEVGGFYIKTAGIYCDDGSLFAVARLADTYKPLLNEGSSKDITLNFKLQIANASESIILKVDNNVVLATRKWSENQFLKKTDKIDAYTKRESDDKFALKTELTDGLPIGAYLSYPSQKAIPAGFLLADGRSLKKSEYPELFNVLGYIYGGSGENFNLPNFSDGKFMRSIGGNAVGLGVVQQDAIDVNSLQLRSIVTDSLGNRNVYGTTGNDYRAVQYTYSTTGTDIAYKSVAGKEDKPIFATSKPANETRPYNMAVVFIIKVKNVNTPTAGQIDKTILATETKAGITKLKNAITAKQEDVAVTEKAVSDVIEANKSIGVGQTYQDVWAQRELNTYYPNTAGRPIMVDFNLESTSGSYIFHIVVDDVVVRKIQSERLYFVDAQFIVPAGSKYKIATPENTALKKLSICSNTNISSSWSELK
ncbi:phage tail-collar fiber domain-containing protein [Campylobacter concisus]|uniref:phage tail-collar fiber domain-containing protein n=2 Tax=Campylobacter concisus TaxID=199 RepID=UPI000D3462DB|nr:phage tail protein [Campylobacter concisus]